jgi:glycosyltransferase involved in cell wall biosynthesis
MLRGINTGTSRHIVALDLIPTGHHRLYLEMLVDYWQAHHMPGRFTLVLGTEFRNRHPGFIERLEELSDCGIGLHEVDADLSSPGKRSGPGRIINLTESHRKAALDAIRRFKPDDLLFMYFDPAQLAVRSLLDECEASSTRISGIYFRATFHDPSLSLRSYLRSTVKKMVLRRAIRTPIFHRLFCLDPYVVPRINRWSEKSEGRTAVPLPDGISSPAPDMDPAELRRRWTFDPNRIVFLFFGSIAQRKGIMELISAINRLERPDLQKVGFVVAGSIPESQQREILNRIDRLSDEVPLILENRYVTEEEMASFFKASDVILAPYIDHVGSSNVALRGAAEGKPVLGPRTGLLGRQIRDHRLGLTVDTSAPQAIAEALVSLANRPEAHFDETAAREFASANSAENYAETIFGELTRDGNLSHSA